MSMSECIDMMCIGGGMLSQYLFRLRIDVYDITMARALKPVASAGPRLRERKYK